MPAPEAASWHRFGRVSGQMRVAGLIQEHLRDVVVAARGCSPRCCPGIRICLLVLRHPVLGGDSADLYLIISGQDRAAYLHRRHGQTLARTKEGIDPNRLMSAAVKSTKPNGTDLKAPTAERSMRVVSPLVRVPGSPLTLLGQLGRVQHGTQDDRRPEIVFCCRWYAVYADDPAQSNLNLKLAGSCDQPSSVLRH